MAREQIPTPEAAPASPAELAPSPQRLPTAKTANASLVEPATDGAPNKAPNGTAEPSTTKPAQPADPAQARTLEQVIGELLEPVIRHWLEANLPRMVEKVVRDEVARALAAEHPAPKT